MVNLESSTKTADPRYALLQTWLSRVLNPAVELEPLAGDASFRRYFRASLGDERYIVMDAPPDREDCRPFVAIARAFQALNLNVPVIHEADYEAGFLLLSDFGDRLFLNELNASTVEGLYQQAIDSLLIIQSCKTVPGYTLPRFDETLYWKEMNLFREWYWEKRRDVALSAEAHAVLDDAFERLTEAALSQPQVCVHLDYHSRNLMVVPGARPGILDFQDARIGPVTYDLVSLLRDCYMDWPVDQVEQWALGYQRKALEAGLLHEEDPQVFLKWFDWMGLQRHLKCLGIFARLKVRDNKPGYLQHIPRIMRYMQAVCARYPEFAALRRFLEKEMPG